MNTRRGPWRSFDMWCDCRYNCGLKAFQCVVLLFLAGLQPVLADTNLFSSGKWVLDGATVSATNMPTIRVVVGRHTVVVSELKFFYNFGGPNVVQVFAITGSGTFQPALPPPGEVGGAFQLGNYQDCAQGLVGPLMVTDLVLPAKAKPNGILQLTGALANGSSLRGDKLVLKFYPPTTNTVQVDVKCRLVATRDFCVEQTAAAEQDKFRMVTMTAGYVSPTDYDNDLARYIRVVEKDCFGWYGCYTRRESQCVSLTNQPPGYLINTPHPLGNPWLELAHTTVTPQATPNLLVAFRTPGPGRIRPQGFLTTTDVALWGNWPAVKKQYKFRQSVTRLNCSLEVTPPRSIRCESLQKP